MDEGASTGRPTDDIVPLVNAAANASWYEDEDNDIDRAAAALCELRRDAPAGDEAVRDVLAHADRGALVWLASRTISYMDEHGFPDTVRPRGLD